MNHESGYQPGGEHQEFQYWDNNTLTEIVKLCSGYYGDYIRSIGLNLLLNYALWVKEYPETSEFHFDEISVIYNYLNTTKIKNNDKGSYYVMIGRINELTNSILEELGQRIIKII